MIVAAILLGVTLLLWVDACVAHGFGEEIRTMLSFAIVVYGLIGQSLLILVLLIARSFRKRRTLIAMLTVSVIIVGLGLPAVVAMWDGTMTVSASRVNIFGLIAVGGAFCFIAPLVQHLMLTRSPKMRQD